MSAHPTRFRFTWIRILAILAALAALGVALRSHKASDWIAYYHDSGAWGLQTFRGRFYLGTSTAWSLPTHETPGGWRYAAVELKEVDEKHWIALAALPYAMDPGDYQSMSHVHFLGIDFKRGFNPGAPTDWLLVIPLWLFAMPFVLLLLMAALRRIKRVERGQCLVCGYDLRSAATCPECGTESISRSVG